VRGGIAELLFDNVNLNDFAMKVFPDATFNLASTEV